MQKTKERTEKETTEENDGPSNGNKREKEEEEDYPGEELMDESDDEDAKNDDEETNKGEDEENVKTSSSSSAHVQSEFFKFDLSNLKLYPRTNVVTLAREFENVDVASSVIPVRMEDSERRRRSGTRKQSKNASEKMTVDVSPPGKSIFNYSSQQFLKNIAQTVDARLLATGRVQAKPKDLELFVRQRYDAETADAIVEYMNEKRANYRASLAKDQEAASKSEEGTQKNKKTTKVGTKKQKSQKEEDGKENEDEKGASKKTEGTRDSEEAELRDTFNRIRTAASAVGGEIGKHAEE